MDEGLIIRCLGKLQIAQGDDAITGFISNKVQALLCYLALNDGPHFRAELAGLLWGEVSEEHARRNLRMALTNLRKLVEPHLQITRQTIAFDPQAPHWLDVAAFEASVEAGLKDEDYQLLKQGADLYGGDFLQGLSVEHAPLFEEWMLAQRERLRSLVIQALHQLSTHYIERGVYAEGIQIASELLALEPWSEEAHRQMMLLLSRNGQRSAALAQYEKCRHTLADELGVEPMEATQVLYERIRAAVSETPHNLPPQPTPFLGREAELEELSARLEQPDCRLLTLTGVGGIGKTRLALELAARKINRFVHGVYFVPLASIDAPQVLPSAIARAVNFKFAGPKDPRDQLHRYLETKEMLLVLDNFEHLLAGADELATLLSLAPELKLLVTSRQRLDLSWEWVFEVEGVEGVSAIQLFQQTAQRLHGRELSESDHPHVVRICKHLDGIPLGIELAATWVRIKSCEEIVEAVEQNLVSLKTSMKDKIQRHRSLQAVFDHSWELLSQAEQRLFERLFLFRGGFSLEAVTEVAGQGDRVDELLVSLVEKSLVRARDWSGETRFSLLEPVRQYSAERLREKAKLCRKHLDFFLELAKRAEPELRGPQQIEWLDRLEVEHDNLRAALQWAIDNVPEAGLCLAGVLGPFWDLRAHLAEGRRWLDRALLASQDAPTPERAKAILAAGSLAILQGDYEGAAPLIEESLTRYRALEDQGGIADSLNRLGRIAYFQADYDKAQARFNESLALFRERDDRPMVAHVLRNLGGVLVFQGEYETARDHFEEGLAILRESGDKEGLSGTLNNLGNVMMNVGEFTRAHTLYEEALNLSRELGERKAVGLLLGNLGLLAQEQGDYERAKGYAEESLAIRREIGDRWGTAWVLSNLGIIAQAQARFEDAEALHQEALCLDREQGDRNREAIDLGNLGNVALLQGGLEIAEAYYTESRAIREEIGYPKGIAMSLICLGHVAHARGAHAKARALYEESLKIRRGLDEKKGIVSSVAALAGSAATQGAQLLGATQQWLQSNGAVLGNADLFVYRQNTATLRDELGEEAFEAAFEQGQALTLDQAIGLALGEQVN